MMFFVSRICCGVSQGSVLGPLLFLLLINDIESVCNVKSTLQLFADDVKLYSSIDLHDHPNSLQLSLDHLSAWANQWQLTINNGKCSVLHLTSTFHQTSCIYFINGTPIPTNSSCIDFGLTVSDDLIPILVTLSLKLVNALALSSHRLDIMRIAFITYIQLH
jgi:ribonucleases P/MRP protein subunit RPP40